MTVTTVLLYTVGRVLIDSPNSVGKSPTETWFGQKLSRIIGAIHY